jgi:hypothetical protein
MHFVLLNSPWSAKASGGQTVWQALQRFGHTCLWKTSRVVFCRDTHGNEVDLVTKKGRKLIPLEIKSAATFTPDFLKDIDRFGKMVGDRCTPGLVLFNGNEQYTIRGTRLINPIKHGGMQGLW